MHCPYIYNAAACTADCTFCTFLTTKEKEPGIPFSRIALFFRFRVDIEKDRLAPEGLSFKITDDLYRLCCIDMAVPSQLQSAECRSAPINLNPLGRAAYPTEKNQYRR